MKKNCFIITISINLFLLFLPIVQANEEVASSAVSFGPVKIGEDRIPINLEDFTIGAYILGYEAKASFVSESVQWIRINDILLVPRAKIELEVAVDSREIGLRYQGRSILFQDRNGKAYTQFYISLFNTRNLDLFISGQKKGFLIISPKESNSIDIKEKHLIDYSCAKYELEIEWPSDEFFSAGCQLIREGSFGEEKGSLDIYWTASDYRLLDENSPPYLTHLTDEYPMRVALIDQKGEKKDLVIKAKVPSRLPRLNTALGFGPYTFETHQGDSAAGPKLTSPVMIYANFYLTPHTSLRAFEALVYQKSYFNNLGLYFAYDVGSAIDNRLTIFPLIGLQLITFSHQPTNRTYHKVIFPQGFEIVYKHAFGIKNFSFVYGMFFSPATSDDYKNLWFRFGKRFFWEPNYISWRNGGDYARMWGLSVGFPLASFF